jgi:hypothetical protein
VKVFLSHASEDKVLVEQVHLRIVKQFPEIKSWLDKYEILAGDDLIEKIHSGITESNRFIIFLSPNSIDKPWVRTELRKALMDEINGIKPEFIIPIKIGTIPTFPPFLESRFYIDIEKKTEEEWLREFYAAIHRKKKPLEEPSENLRVTTHIALDNPKAAMVAFEALYWAEPISFRISTKARIKSTIWQLHGLKGMIQISITELKSEKVYSIALPSHTILPKKPFVIGLEFDETDDPREQILEIGKWDGTGGQSSINFMDFK